MRKSVREVERERVRTRMMRERERSEKSETGRESETERVIEIVRTERMGERDINIVRSE